MITPEFAQGLSNEELLDMLDTVYQEYNRVVQTYKMDEIHWGTQAAVIHILRAEALRRMAPPSVDVPF